MKKKVIKLALIIIIKKWKLETTLLIPYNNQI